MGAQAQSLYFCVATKVRGRMVVFPPSSLPQLRPRMAKMGGRITLTHNYAAADANRPAAELKHNVSRVFAAGSNPRTPHTPAVSDLTQICTKPVPVQPWQPYFLQLQISESSFLTNVCYVPPSSSKGYLIIKNWFTWNHFCFQMVGTFLISSYIPYRHQIDSSHVIHSFQPSALP